MLGRSRAGSAQVDGAHAGKPESVEKPYLKSRRRASGSYSKRMQYRSKPGIWTAVVVAAVVSMAAAAGGPPSLVASRPSYGETGGIGSIKSQDLREWLGYIASDELQGREVYSAGIGLAAAYIEDHLKAWGVKPAGDHGAYLQSVRVLGVKATSHA